LRLKEKKIKGVIMLKRLLLSITLILTLGAFVNADETAQNAAPEALNIAVADDFAPVAEELGKEFTHMSGIPVNFTTGSSEELLQMIKKGGQFDVYMSANTNYPVDLEKSGFTDGSPEIYAIGSLALYAKGKKLTHNGLDVLQPGGFSKLGVADPKMSPYGVAAIETLKKLQIYEQVQGQIVYADDVEKVLKMAESGEVDAGLVAYGDLSDELKLKAWIVPGRMHSHIEQSMVALKNANAAATKKWMMFIESDTAKNILVSSGFGVTNVEEVE
jgi:molybdate transport system substrate-binding protein